MVITIGHQNENTFSKNEAVCLNQIDKTGDPICLASVE
jgi:hypothetical protein